MAEGRGGSQPLVVVRECIMPEVDDFKCYPAETLFARRVRN